MSYNYEWKVQPDMGCSLISKSMTSGESQTRSSVSGYSLVMEYSSFPL